MSKKVIFIKPMGSYTIPEDQGTIHLVGMIDTTACGIPDENWEQESTNKPLTCEMCKEALRWARTVSKVKYKV